MVEAKRVKGSRDAPTLPPLSEEDFKPILWEGAKKASWTLEEAACYVNEKSPDTKIDVNGTDEVSRAYVWLAKEVEKGRLNSIIKISDDAFSPGTVMRHLWEAEKPVSLKMWALYTYADKGEISGLLKQGISSKNYIKAAAIIENDFPSVSRAKIIQFLMRLPDKIHGKNGIPVFFNMSDEYLRKLLSKELGKRSAGRKKGEDVVDLEEHSELLLNKIKKELGY